MDAAAMYPSKVAQEQLIEDGYTFAGMFVVCIIATTITIGFFTVALV